MSRQNYILINKATNVVENIIVWDGDTKAWMPPEELLVLVNAQTPAIVWDLNVDKTDYELVEKLGFAEKDFTWDGRACITNQEKPAKPTEEEIAKKAVLTQPLALSPEVINSNIAASNALKPAP